MSQLNVVGSLQERGRSLEKMTWEAVWGGKGGWTFWKGDLLERVSGNRPGGRGWGGGAMGGVDEPEQVSKDQ